MQLHCGILFVASKPVDVKFKYQSNTNATFRLYAQKLLKSTKNYLKVFL